jgi:methionyl-tRNA formyltransferase
MGFGKMPAECAKILVCNSVQIHSIWETEKSDFSPLEGLCAKNKIPFKRGSRKEMTSFLDSLQEPTLIFSINNNYIFPQNISEKKKLRIINFHNSLLPCYPGHGLVIPAWAIFNGEVKHGVTWHLVSDTLDGGDIICQEEFSISEQDTALDVMTRAIYIGIELFSKYWDNFLAERLIGRPQGPRKERIYRRSDIPNNGLIDPSWDFNTMSRFLRSMDYGPFRLLPRPKIKIGDSMHTVELYEIKQGKGLRTQDMYPKQSILTLKIEIRFFYYKEGVIRLVLGRKNHEK